MSYTRTAYNEDTNARRIDVSGTTYFLLGSTENKTDIEAPVMADAFDSMFFEASRPLTDEEIFHLSGLIGYKWKSTVRGQRLEDVRRHDERSFEIIASLNSSHRSEPMSSFDIFAEELNDFIAEGSPVRSSDGVQKVKGMENVTVTIWLPEVTQELEPDNFGKVAAATAKMEKFAARKSPFAPSLLSGKTTEEITAKVTALVSIKDSLTPGEQDILTMAHDLMVAQADLVAKLAEAEVKLAAVRSALSV